MKLLWKNIRGPSGAASPAPSGQRRGRAAPALIVVFLAISHVSPAAPFQTPAFTAEEMLGTVGFSGGQPVALSPTGEWVAYVLPDMQDEWNIQERRPVGYVHVQAVDTGAGEARALSVGEAHSSFPVWSPDGEQLAFFIEEADGGRLAVWTSATGRVRTLGETFSGRPYMPPQWDPSGQRIVYATAMADKNPGEPPRVRVVRSSDKRIPGDAFFINKRMARLAVADLSSARSRTLLDEPVYLRSFDLDPSGRQLIYVAPSPETFGIVGQETNESFLLPVTGKAPPRKIGGGGRSLSWSPDGARLLYRENGKLVVIPLAGGAPQPFLVGLKVAPTNLVFSPDGSSFLSLVPDRSLQDPEIEPPQPGMYSIARPFMDLYLISTVDGSTHNLTASIEDQISSPVWSPDGKSVFFRAVDNHSYDQTLYRYSLSEGKLAALAAGEETYGDLSVARGRLTVTIQDATHPPDLWLIDTDSGERKRLTTLNPQLTHFRFSKPELFYFHNQDGERLGALLYKPVGFEEGDKVPVITYVYEKLTPGIHRFSPRHQIFLNHGYAVLMPNVKVKVGETGTSFVKSVVPAVNAVRDMGITNGKFALWGGSFGAYATSYVITQTKIFACAVSRATPPELFRNWASGRDRDSINIERGQARMGAGPFEAMERYISQSAFFHLDKVNTPVLIMHGVNDRTILFGEGEMMFYTLRQLGKEATFVIYTHGDHSLSRHSRADALDVNRRMLAWFEHYLK